MVVLKAAISLAPLLFGFGALGAVRIDALLCEIVCSASSGDQDTPAIAVMGGLAWCDSSGDGNGNDDGNDDGKWCQSVGTG